MAAEITPTREFGLPNLRVAVAVVREIYDFLPPDLLGLEKAQHYRTTGWWTWPVPRFKDEEKFQVAMLAYCPWVRVWFIFYCDANGVPQVLWSHRPTQEAAQEVLAKYVKEA